MGLRQTQSQSEISVRVAVGAVVAVAVAVALRLCFRPTGLGLYHGQTDSEPEGARVNLANGLHCAARRRVYLSFLKFFAELVNFVRAQSLSATSRTFMA